jgi:hypothetical protein
MSKERLGVCIRAVALTGMAALVLAAGASAHASKRVVRVHPMTRTGALRPFSRTGALSDFGRKGRYNDTVESSNWSGYAVEEPSGTQFTEVIGSYVQPAVSCSSRTAQYASFWAGIDGYSSDSVEQLGTDSDCDGINDPSYYAWYEMYPANSVSLPTRSYPVSVGDTLTATVSVNGSSYTLSISDTKSGGTSPRWTYSTVKTGSGLADSSAELIAESPEICSGRRCSLAELSDFGTVSFSGVQAAATNAVLSPFSAFTYDNGPHDIIATTNNGTYRAEPSALNGTSFSITWHHD